MLKYGDGGVYSLLIGGEVYPRIYRWAVGRTVLARYISNFSWSLPRYITSYSMKNLAFHRLLKWKMIILPILTTSLMHFCLPFHYCSLTRNITSHIWRTCFYIAYMHMKNDCTCQFSLPHLYIFLFKKPLGGCTFLTFWSVRQTDVSIHSTKEFFVLSNPRGQIIK